MEITPTVTAIAAVAAVKDSDLTSNPLVMVVIAAFLSAIVTLTVTSLQRHFTTGDRQHDQATVSTQREVDHVVHNVDMAQHGADREFDAVQRGEHRELDLIWSSLSRLEAGQTTTSATLGQIQLALYRLELEGKSLKQYVEDQKELTKIYGAARSGTPTP